MGAIASVLDPADPNLNTNKHYWNSVPNTVVQLPSKQQLIDTILSIENLNRIPAVIVSLVADYTVSLSANIAINSNGQLIDCTNSNISINNGLSNYIHPETVIASVVLPDERIIVSTSGLSIELPLLINNIPSLDSKNGRLLLYNPYTDRIELELQGHTSGQCNWIRFVSLLLLPNNHLLALCRCKTLHYWSSIHHFNRCELLKLPPQLRSVRRKTLLNIAKHYFMALLPAGQIAILITPYQAPDKYQQRPNLIHRNSVNSAQIQPAAATINTTVSATNSPQITALNPPSIHRSNSLTINNSTSHSNNYTSFFCVVDLPSFTTISRRTLTRDSFASSLIYHNSTNRLLSEFSDGIIRCWDYSSISEERAFTLTEEIICSHFEHSIIDRCKSNSINNYCQSLPSLNLYDGRWFSICNNLHLCIHSNNRKSIQSQLIQLVTIDNIPIRIESAALLPSGLLCCTELYTGIIRIFNLSQNNINNRSIHCITTIELGNQLLSNQLIQSREIIQLIQDNTLD